MSDQLDAALAVLGLAQLPESIGKLADGVVARNPNPSKWSWVQVAAYQLALNTIAQLQGSSTRATGGPGRDG